MSKTTAACNSHPTALKRAQKELRNETEKTQNFRCFDQDFSTILPINLQKFACGKKIELDLMVQGIPHQIKKKYIFQTPQIQT